jgi:hypothetical protein
VVGAVGHTVPIRADLAAVDEPQLASAGENQISRGQHVITGCNEAVVDDGVAKPQLGPGQRLDATFDRQIPQQRREPRCSRQAVLFGTASPKIPSIQGIHNARGVG